MFFPFWRVRGTERRGDGSDPELPRENPWEIDCMELALARRALVDLTCINYARGSAAAFFAGVIAPELRGYSRLQQH